MRYFLDTEFIEDGKTIDLISIGIVADDGRELYLQNTEAHFERASEWVKEHVFPHLKGLRSLTDGAFVRGDGPWDTRFGISEQVGQFCDPAEHGPPEFWGYYADYDWVALCQLFGTMMDRPKEWPMYCRDLRQWADQLGITGDLDGYVDATGEHHALADAHFNAAAWEFLTERAKVVA